MQHIQKAMTKRFTPIGEPYGRYRKFVNICAIKVVSQTSPIGKGATAFNCTGDDQSRLATCDSERPTWRSRANIPAGFEVDWKAVVLNNDRWWNTGALLMLWSGAHKDAAGAALHEGGHGFHQLADEYAGTGGNCAREYGEVNSTVNMAQTGGKWDLWLDYVQTERDRPPGPVRGLALLRQGAVPAVAELDDEQPVRRQPQHLLQLGLAREDDHGHLARGDTHRRQLSAGRRRAEHQACSA